MANESYDDLIFQLGDLAREHLAEKPTPPVAMEKVFQMEDALVACREELEQLETDLNGEDAKHADFLDQHEIEKADQLRVVGKWRAAVAGVEVRSRDLKKKISSLKAAHRYQKKSMKLAEEKHKDLELREGHDVRKITLSKENLKKLRLGHMRDMRNIEDLEYEFKSVLTPRPGQQGAQGILAHKRLLEMEDELETEQAEHTDRMKAIDEALAAKEEEVKQCEADLDSAIFELGEEVYADRINHAKLNPLYPRLDKAK